MRSISWKVLTSMLLSYWRGGLEQLTAVCELELENSDTYERPPDGK
jgi:hypothetical protein